MEKLSSKIIKKENRPIKIIQFGEGNFLRAFQDYFIDILNSETDFNGGIAVIKPREKGSLEKFYNQDLMYTVDLTSKDGEELRTITSLSLAINPYEKYDEYIGLSKNPELKIAFSNTTESGIEFKEEAFSKLPTSFPGKVTAFLYERYKYFNGDKQKGISFFPSELIDNNGAELLKCINKYIDYWNLDLDFKNWVNSCCYFYNTLVDRIVSGFPKDKKDEIYEKLGFTDELLVSGEKFGLWVIEAGEEVASLFKLHEISLPIVITDDISKYKKRKVRILNGAHTSFTAFSYMLGYDYVKDALNDELIYTYLVKLFKSEIVPILTDVNDPMGFTEDVIKRFKNPYINHKLLDICLNSFSKWETRCLPSLLDYIKKYNELPKLLLFGLASIITLYKNVDENDFSSFEGKKYLVQESKERLDFLRSTDDVLNILGSKLFFKNDLTEIPNLKNVVSDYLNSIEKEGLKKTLWKILK